MVSLWTALRTTAFNQEATVCERKAGAYDPPPLNTWSSAAMPGFDFSNHNRNAALHAQGVPLPKATSTGTTIVGAIFDGGVVIAADTRATSGPIVADKVQPSHWSCYILRWHRFRLRIARNCTTSLLKYGAPAPEQLQTQNLPLPSSHPTLNSMLYRQAANPAPSHVWRC